MDDQPATVPTLPVPSPGASTALAHLYRGELGRMVSYRRRLDTTTNWAISVVSAVVTLVLGTEAVSHAVVLTAMVPLAAFLFLEAGRFRHYELSRARVRLLEQGYFPDELRSRTDWLWIGPLIEQLQHPTPPIDRLSAIGWRLRRNYLWIYLVLLAAWLLKLDIVTRAGGDVGVLLAGAGFGPLPGPGVAAIVAACYAVLVGLAVTSARRYPEAEDW